MNNSKNFITPKKAAEAFGVEAATVRRWFNFGKVPGFRVNGRIFIKRSALEDFMGMVIK